MNEDLTQQGTEWEQSIHNYSFTVFTELFDSPLLSFWPLVVLWSVAFHVGFHFVCDMHVGDAIHIFPSGFTLCN